MDRTGRRDADRRGRAGPGRRRHRCRRSPHQCHRRPPEPAGCACADPGRLAGRPGTARAPAGRLAPVAGLAVDDLHRPRGRRPAGPGAGAGARRDAAAGACAAAALGRRHHQSRHLDAVVRRRARRHAVRPGLPSLHARLGDHHPGAPVLPAHGRAAGPGARLAGLSGARRRHRARAPGRGRRHRCRRAADLGTVADRLHRRLRTAAARAAAGPEPGDVALAARGPDTRPGSALLPPPRRPLRRPDAAGHRRCRPRPARRDRPGARAGGGRRRRRRPGRGGLRARARHALATRRTAGARQRMAPRRWQRAQPARTARCRRAPPPGPAGAGRACRVEPRSRHRAAAA